MSRAKDQTNAAVLAAMAMLVGSGAGQELGLVRSPRYSGHLNNSGDLNNRKASTARRSKRKAQKAARRRNRG